MGELLDFLKKKYKGKMSYDSEDVLPRTVVKNTIVSICDDKLKNVGDILTFEVLDKDLAFAVSVIEEEPLASRYDIVQVSRSLFQASLKEVDL